MKACNRRVGVYAVMALLMMAGWAAPAVTAELTKEYSDSEIRQMLQQIARDMNRTLPRMLDDEIRLDAVEIRGREIRYRNTLVNYRADQIDRNVILSKTHKRLMDSFCKGESRDVYLEHGIRVSYIYSGNDGKEIASLRIDPASKECRKVAG